MLTLLRCDSDSAAGPIPFDRRSTRREPIEGTAMAAVRVDHAATVVPVRLTDVSAAGMGVQAQVPLGIGSVVEIHTDASGVPSCVGRVARVLAQDGGGYRIGLRFERRAAA